MRTTAIPSMLEVLARNYANRNLCCQMYEIATEYRKQGGPDDLPDESEAVLIGMSGGESDFYRLKGCLLYTSYVWGFPKPKLTLKAWSI